MDKIVDRGEAERFLKGLGLKVQEGVVRQILATIRGETDHSPYSLYNNRGCGKGTAYKIKDLYNDGVLKPYLAYLDAGEERDTSDQHLSVPYSLLSTGYGDIDRLIGEIRRSELLILAGEATVGKTTLPLKIAANVARNGFSVGFISLETTEGTLRTGFLARETKIDPHMLELGLVTEAHERRISDGQKANSNNPIYWASMSEYEIEEIRGRARQIYCRVSAQLDTIEA